MIVLKNNNNIIFNVQIITSIRSLTLDERRCYHKVKSIIILIPNNTYLSKEKKKNFTVEYFLLDRKKIYKLPK